MAKGTLNKVILIGRLGLDPEVRYTPNGAAVATLSLATNDAYKDKSGQTIEKTEWHRVVFIGKLAEVLAEYARKGTLLYIEGRIRTNKWKDSAGNDRYTTEISGNEMQFLGGKTDGSSSSVNFDEPKKQVKSAGMDGSEKPNGQYPQDFMSSGPALSPVPEMDSLIVEDDDIPF